MRRSASASFWLAVFIAALPGCGSSSDGSVDLDPRSPSGFAPATETTEQQALIDEMLNAMILPPGECWDASVIVGGAQPTGIVSQWQFDQDSFGNLGYRFVGFDTHTGAVLLQAIGRFEGRPTALVETWTGGPEAFVLVSSSELVHVSINPGGGLSSVRYGTSRGTCL
jgi:hypothetical protein